MPEASRISRRHTPRAPSRPRHAPLSKKKRPRRTAIPDSSSDNGSVSVSVSVSVTPTTTTTTPSGPVVVLQAGSGDANSAAAATAAAAAAAADDDDWYAIKDIIEERVEKRRRFYKVDWADHPETGASYPPSWIPARDASSDAVKAWKSARQSARATSSTSSSYVHESVEDPKTPEPTPVSRKRAAASPSRPEDHPPAKKQKGLREVPHPPPVLLSSDPFSRDVSTESPELEPDPVPVTRSSKDLAIELNPGSDFDPDDYLRFSQLQSQSQAQFQPQPQPQLQSLPQPHHLFSPRTIPDSEADTATHNSTLEPRPGAATIPSAGASVPSAPRDSFPPLPHQPAVELRETADWNSDHSSDRADRAGSENSVFLTQPEADFDLLSAESPSQPATARRTPASPDHRSWSPSIVPDSTRREALPDRDLHPAQIVQLLQSRHEPEAVILPPAATLSRPPRTPSQLDAEGYLEESMDGDDAPLDPVELLRKAHLDALGPEGLIMTELPSDTIKRYLAQQDDVRSSPPDVAFAGQAAMEAAPATPLATIDTSLLVGPETAMPDLPDLPDLPAEMGTIGLAAGESSLAIHGGLSNADANANANANVNANANAIADVSATIAPMALSLTAPVLSISPEPAAEAAAEAAAAAHRSPSPNSLTDMSDSPVSTEADRERRESLSPSAFASSSHTREYTVTLPLAANSRQRYIDLIMDKENQKTIREFGAVFARDTRELPSPERSVRVDSLLQKLLDLTDLPPFADSLPPLTAEAMMKYAANTNGKFTFLHELLEPSRAADKKVLILARKGVLLDYIEALVTRLGLPLVRIGKDVAGAADGGGGGASASASASDSSHSHSHHRLAVVLADTEASPASLPQEDVDVVIGFDHTARTSGLLANYLDKADRPSGPVVLLLVTSYTLEHIDLRLPLNGVGDQERKNALLLCTLECLPHLQDSVYDDQPVRPHEAAAAFAKVVSDPRVDIGWKALSLPDDVFDIYISSSQSAHPVLSQEESASPANFGGLSRKHQLHDNDGIEDDDEAQKRARPNGFAHPIVPNQDVPLSDTLKTALHGPLTTSGPTVTLSLSQLEALAARTVALESQLREKEIQEAMLLERVRTLDRLAKDTAATVVVCERKLLEAVKDRGVFEVERDRATREVEAARERQTSRESVLAELQRDKAALTAKLAEATGLLSGSTVPAVARLAAAEAETEAARRQTAALERKVANAETDLAHARRAYQDASNAAADLSAENRDLGTRAKELGRLAAENLRQIHETNQRGAADEHRRQWAEMQVVMRERDRELEWAREELRLLKNGRRETRAQSVPRSPRLGVMSPRTVAGRTATMAGPVAAGDRSSSSTTTTTTTAGIYNNNGRSASVSRGNSPIAGSFDGSGPGGSGVGVGVGVGVGTGVGAGAGAAPVPGLTYLNQQQGGGRWGHLRD